MNKKIAIEFAVGIIILVALVFGAYAFFQAKQVQAPVINNVQKNMPQKNNQNQNDKNSQIVNPASVYCEQNGGKVEIRTNPDGSQSGYCVFPDGRECEEWAFFRGECKK